jgi:hypothetical protein
MSKQKINVQGLTITIEQVKDSDYISLTDIAKKSDKEARFLIMSWLKNRSTLEFLETWEELHNPDFKRDHLVTFKDKYLQNRNILTPQNWISETNAIGLVSKSGRYGGGTYAHKDIALNFCYWLSPSFQVYLIKEFQRLKEEEFSKKNLEWHIERITNLVDETRNWLDTVPGQKPERNRLNFLKERNKE